jgi:hypothetical protein
LPRIIPHALVLQPNARHWLRAFAGQINSSNQARDEVSDKYRSLTAF